MHGPPAERPVRHIECVHEPALLRRLLGLPIRQLYKMTDDAGMEDMPAFLVSRDTMHQNQWLAAWEELGDRENHPIDLDIEEYTGTEHDVMIDDPPHGLAPAEPHAPPCSYWNRLPTAELYAVLHEATSESRADGDSTRPAPREGWDPGDYEPFSSWGEKPMERVTGEMARVVD